MHAEYLRQFGQRGVNMAIIVNLDVMMAKRKISLTELAGQVDLTLANLSILKNNKARAVRFSTLEAICRALNCQPGDILEFVSEEGSGGLPAANSLCAKDGAEME